MNQGYKFFSLLFWLTVSVLIFASWFAGTFSAHWQEIDKLVFFSLNGMVANDEDIQVFWALANNRLYDLLPAILILLIYLVAYLKSDDQNRKFKMAAGIFMAIYTVLMIQLAHFVFDFDRNSPSLVLKPAYMLSEIVPWAKPKDASGNSFPGDHAAVLLIVSFFIIHLQGRKYFLPCFLVVLIGVMPRLVSGAHWFSDVAVGSLSIAIFAVAMAVKTPFMWKVVKVISKKLP